MFGSCLQKDFKMYDNIVKSQNQSSFASFSIQKSTNKPQKPLN